MKVIGYCRFSYFGVTDTGRRIATEADAHELLWSKNRMACRFHLFKNLLIPSLKAQTDQDFIVYVITSKEMPRNYHVRLARIVRDIPQIRILKIEDQDLHKVLRKTIFEDSDEGTKRTVQFRIDDDDALGVEVIERLRKDGEILPERTLISYPRGVTSFLDGEIARCTVQFKAYIAIGLATVNGPGDYRNPFLMQHRKAFLKRPSFVDPSFSAYIYTLHSVNNTLGYDNAPSPTSVGRRSVERVLRNTPQLSKDTIADEAIEALATGFPYMSGKKLNGIVERASHLGFVKTGSKKSP